MKPISCAHGVGFGIHAYQRAGILTPMPGTKIRTDIVEVYAFRVQAVPDRGSGDCPEISFLQMRRCKGRMVGSWQPVMGHVEEGETCTEAALRELKEETGYTPENGLTSLWQLESVNTYFLANDDCVMMSPGFAALVSPDVSPRLDDAHDDFRWVKRDHADRMFVWPGQRVAIDQIVRDVVPSILGLEREGKPSVESVLRIKLDSK